MGTIAAIAIRRWLEAVTTVPTATDWVRTGLWLLGYGLMAVPLGVWRGWLTWEPVSNWRVGASAATIAFLVPSVLEEVLFRVTLVPHPTEAVTTQTLLGWAIASLVLFVAAHPLNAALYLTAARPTFFDPAFLICAGILGAICTVVYWQSGSLWPPTVLHWIAVAIWLLCLGGLRRTSPSEAGGE
ncbi:type II CAAX prenyl endopeptidase Rce1 family protein [Synechococcus sp. PCC 7336]|uniref:CPBP family glutamic-type intramembrane protease n=1 Tax=Synechococcus sp. PCC 7336 TaxID=195250 RepID=UPI000347EF3F|nr:CPBP family glutamic-type intramembrane protease [Synechococcus sp. PCC 7336]